MKDKKYNYSAESDLYKNGTVEMTYVKRHFSLLPDDYDNATCWCIDEKTAQELIGEEDWCEGGTECDYDVVVLSKIIN